jgi:hypothetical protein
MQRIALGLNPSGSIPGYAGPSGNIGYGPGVGETGPIPTAASAPAMAAANPSPPSNQGLNNMMGQMGMKMLQPQQIQAPQIQMARPVGPGQMPQGGQGAYPPAGWNVSTPPMAGMLNRFGF